MLLGNTSWRIRRVQAGSVLVEDAQALLPPFLFWRREAPARTDELSTHVALLREENQFFFPGTVSDPVGKFPPEASPAISWLKIECGLDDAGRTGSRIHPCWSYDLGEVQPKPPSSPNAFRRKRRHATCHPRAVWRAHQQSLGSRAP